MKNLDHSRKKNFYLPPCVLFERRISAKSIVNRFSLPNLAKKSPEGRLKICKYDFHFDSSMKSSHKKKRKRTEQMLSTQVSNILAHSFFS